MTRSVGAKTLPVALSNLEDWPSGPELALGYNFFIIFAIFSEFVYSKEKAKLQGGPK